MNNYRYAYEQLRKVSEFSPTHLNVAWLTEAWNAVKGDYSQEAKDVRITVRHHALATLTGDFPQWLQREADRYVRVI